MHDLRNQLHCCFHDGACLMGLGNVDYGDDGFGVRLAEQLLEAGLPEVVVAGTAPHRFLPRALERRPAHVIFADSVEFGGTPGSVVLLNANEIVARFPQVSTHKISLGLFAKYAQADGRTHCWLLGAQPESLKPGAGLTPAIQKTVRLLTQMITRANGEPL